MTVYLDIIFIYNLLIDWILLWSTAFILKQKPKWYRLALGASLGAGYTVVLFFPPLSGSFTFIAKMALSMVMVLSVFGFHRLLVFMQRVLIFYLVAFVLGGGLLGIHFFLQSESEILSGIVMTQAGGLGTPVTWGFIAVAFPLLWWLSGKGWKNLKENQRKASFHVEMKIYIQDHAISCRGLIDTGNQLFEPITRLPVNIVDIEVLKEILPMGIYQTVKEHTGPSSAAVFMELDDDWLQRIRMIPYRSISRGMDLLTAIRPDKVQILMDGKWFETTRALIGLNSVRLSSDGSYQAIVHPRLTDEEFLIHRCGADTSKEAI